MILDAVHRVSNGGDLDEATAYACCRELMSGDASHALVAELLTSLRAKGVAKSELIGFVKAMREAALPVSVDRPTIDTAGTGGGVSTFNISTTAAFVIAATGQAVAKHGNRSVSTQCGAADVLEALGAQINQGPDDVRQSIEETGFGFLFAQAFHPAMRHVAPVRREVGGQTIFNLAGPLANPIRTEYQLVGASSHELAELLASALSGLGVQRAFVVSGHQGCDEVTVDGQTEVFDIDGQAITQRQWTGLEFGIRTAAEPVPGGRSPGDNAGLLRRVLDGESGPARDVVLINAAAALLACNDAWSPVECAERAREAIDSGAATKVLDSYIELSNK